MINAPQHATLYLTDHCQFACNHCFLTDQMTLNKNNLSRTAIDACVESFANNKVFMIVVSGGDPTLNPYFRHTITKLRMHKLLPLLGINALIYPDSLLTFIRSQGLKHLQVGIDYLGSERRAIKGRCFQSSNKALKHITSHGFKVTVAITVTSDNVSSCLDLAKAVLSIDGVDRVKFSLWKKTGRGNQFGFKELGDGEQEKLLSALCQLKIAQKSLVVPGYERVGDRFTRVRNTVPKFVIRANGDMAFSEFFKPFSNLSSLKDKNVVSCYLKHLKVYCDDEMTRVISLARKIANVRTAWTAPRSQINGSGIIFQTDNAFQPIVASDLNASEKFFVILHEIGHVVLGLISPSRKFSRRRSVERSVNKWVMRRIRDMVSTTFFNRGIEMVNSDREEELFQLFRHHLYHNILLREDKRIYNAKIQNK